jgi:excisionase family DNA binding protein
MGKKISLKAASDELGVSKSSLRRMITTGELPAVRIGKGRSIIRIDVDDLAKVVNPVVPSSTGMSNTKTVVPRDLSGPLKLPAPLPRKRTAKRPNASRRSA